MKQKRLIEAEKLVTWFKGRDQSSLHIPLCFAAAVLFKGGKTTKIVQCS